MTKQPQKKCYTATCYKVMPFEMSQVTEYYIPYGSIDLTFLDFICIKWINLLETECKAMVARD